MCMHAFMLVCDILGITVAQPVTDPHVDPKNRTKIIIVEIWLNFSQMPWKCLYLQHISCHISFFHVAIGIQWIFHFWLVFEKLEIALVCRFGYLRNLWQHCL